MRLGNKSDIKLAYKNIRKSEKFGVEKLSFEFDISINLSFMLFEQRDNVGCENLRSDLRRKVHNTRSTVAE